MTEVSNVAEGAPELQLGGITKADKPRLTGQEGHRKEPVIM